MHGVKAYRRNIFFATTWIADIAGEGPGAVRVNHVFPPELDDSKNEDRGSGVRAPQGAGSLNVGRHSIAQR